jgi:hypothetical protein
MFISLGKTPMLGEIPVFISLGEISVFVSLGNLSISQAVM